VSNKNYFVLLERCRAHPKQRAEDRSHIRPVRTVRVA